MVAMPWATIHLEEAGPMTHVRVLGIDIAKQIFHVVGMDDSGTVVLRKRCPRGALMSFIAQLPPVVIGMEVCGGAHY
jgi:transposase